MEKIIKEYEVYTFDELNEDIKEKLIEEEIERQYEDYIELYLYEDMYLEAERLLEKYFGKKAELDNIYYSLSYCQGDGAMMEFTTEYYGKYVKVRQYGHYYHEYSFDIDSYELTDKQYEQFKEKTIKMNKEFAKYGWKMVDIDTHKDYLKEYAMERLSENEYLENGEIF